MAETQLYIICHEQGGIKCGPIKIGVSDNPEKRLRQLSTGNPNKLCVYANFYIPDREIAFYLERMFKACKSDLQLEGEWFDDRPQVAMFFVMIALHHHLTMDIGLDKEEAEQAREISMRDCKNGLKVS